jgi:dTMP kinase
MTRAEKSKPKGSHILFPAKFVSFEGIDGCGKSTLMDQLEGWLRLAEVPCIRTREPGGTPIGERIRKILLDPACSEMCARAEALLYSASRAQLTEQVILPALKNDTWVLVDRFVDATFAYQGYGRGFDLDDLEAIQKWTTGGLWPDKTILIDCDIDTARLRLQMRDGASRDRIEQEDRLFHQKVRDGYLALAAREPSRFLVLDGSKPLEKVIEEFHERFWMQETWL